MTKFLTCYAKQIEILTNLKVIHFHVKCRFNQADIMQTKSTIQVLRRGRLQHENDFRKLPNWQICGDNAMKPLNANDWSLKHYWSITEWDKYKIFISGSMSLCIIYTVIEQLNWEMGTIVHGLHGSAYNVDDNQPCLYSPALSTQQTHS